MTDQSTPASTEAAGLPRYTVNCSSNEYGTHWQVESDSDGSLCLLSDAQAAITRVDQLYAVQFREAVQPLRDQVARLERENELAKAAPLYSTREDAARWRWWKPWIERRVGDLAPYAEARRKGEAAEDALKAAPLDVEAKAARYDWLVAGRYIRQDKEIRDRGGRIISKSETTALMSFNYWCTPEELDAAIDREALRCELTKGAK